MADHDDLEGNPSTNASENGDSSQQQSMSASANSSDKDIKAREKNLRLAEAVAPPPAPSMSLTSDSTRTSKDNTDDSATAKEGTAGISLALNSSSHEERNALRYSTNQAAKQGTKVRNSREIPPGPGAVRVGDRVDEEQGLALTAEAVDDDERIRALQESNEQLRRQVEMALESERRALEEMQTMAHAPPANVTVVMGGDAATSVKSEATREMQAAQAEKQCCWDVCRTTAFMAGCCCLFCVMIVLVIIFAVGLDNLIATSTTSASEQADLATRRSNLEELLRPLEPFHTEALDWLVNVDQWRPEMSNGTLAPSPNNDQTAQIDDIRTIIDSITQSIGGSTVGTGAKKWMFIERYYLAVLYFSTKGDNWKQNYGWLSETSSHCAGGAKGWFGIQCENDSVVSIELESNNLAGTFPKEIHVLSNLRSIWISGDGFDDKMAGSIPEKLPANLTQIWLWAMKLSGTIPEQLFELSGLTSLRLYENQLSGTISSSILQLSDLKTLHLVGNQLTGTIPVLPNVTSCDLATNKFVETSNGSERGCVVFDQNP